MFVCLSAHRITYTPLNGEPMELLHPLQLCDALPAFDGTPETQVDTLLLADWVAHHSRGNARANLRWDAYEETPCRTQAQARALELWRYLTTHPEGSLVYETAFLGVVSAPLIRWELHATLSRVEAQELDVESAPFAGPGYHATYDFLISFPQTHG